MGGPPPLGVGYVWITFGWTCLAGSSITPQALASLITRGVARKETIAASASGKSTNSNKLGIYMFPTRKTIFRVAMVEKKEEATPARIRVFLRNSSSNTTPRKKLIPKIPEEVSEGRISAQDGATTFSASAI